VNPLSRDGSVVHPDKLEVDLRIGHLGNSSVRCEFGISKEEAEELPACLSGCSFVRYWVKGGRY
tara:strand:+ start:530 stop:721 length:192 start_codon:yes stop_codon:yes gene_type:complete